MGAELALCLRNVEIKFSEVILFRCAQGEKKFMQTFYKVAQIFGRQTGVFRVPTAKRGDVFLCVRRTNYLNDERTVVEVDAMRFLDLWRQPYSSHEDVAHRTPETWPRDYKFHEAESGFSGGESNPVPLARVGCYRQVIERAVWQRKFWFFQRFAGVEITHFPTLGFSDGVTRTIWLLTAGATVFPVECPQRDAAFLQEMAGVAGGSIQTVEQLVPAYNWSMLASEQESVNGDDA